MTKRKYLYFNEKTGDIKQATKSQAKFMPADWCRIEFVKNEKGKDVMRFKFNNATVDIAEREEVKDNVEPNAN